MKRDLRFGIVALAALGVAAMVVAAVTATTVWVAALAVGVVALTGTVCLVVVRAAHQIHRVQVRLEKLAVANHKRASEWNRHLTEAVTGKASSTRPFANAMSIVTHASAVPASSRAHEQAGELVASGVFDAEYYAALVGGTFESARDAASHYLHFNAARGIVPSPFLTADDLPPAVQAALASGDVRPLLAYLRSEAACAGPLSAIFDARYAGVGTGEASRHPGGALGVFLARMDDVTPLAVAPDAPAAGATASSVRRALVGHARQCSAAREIVGPREQPSWDASAEARWLSTLRSASVGALPKVSVIMAVKDRAGVVGQAIRSVQGQSHIDWELLVVDDGSQDGTLEVVRRLAESDPRIRVLANRGTGVSAARNTGLDAVTGEYVAFLDSDNQWVPHFLETMLQAMVRDSLPAAYAAVEIRSAEGTRYRAFDGGLAHLGVLNHIDLNVLVVHRSLALGVRFDESLRRWVDHDFAIKIARKAVPRLLPFIGCIYDHDTAAGDRITVRESEHWQWVALERYWADWDQAAQTVPGRVSVVIPTYNDAEMTIDAVRSVLRDADAWALDVEVIVVDNGSRLQIGQEILSTVGAAPHVVYQYLPRNLNFAIACNVGVIRATGEYTLFLNNDTIVRHGVLGKLIKALDAPGVMGAQPLLVYDDETIQTAGTVFPTAGSLPCHLLTGHPPADALPLAGALFDAVTAAALIMRTAQARELRGFDAIFVNGMEDVDLCLRAREELGGYFAVVPEAVVTHLESKTPGRSKNIDENRRLFIQRWDGQLPGPQDHLYRRAGYVVAHVGTDGRTVPGPKPVVVRDPADTRTRWGIKIASIPGDRGDRWGDTHFAESLRRALDGQGQHAVVHRHGAHQTPATGFDDVVLAIRGLDRVQPMPGKTNILWVISHPEDVTVEELREFDHVFAASEPWALKMTSLSGRPVHPLLQATDPTRFNTTIEPVPVGKPLFVGGTHTGRDRPIVTTALQAGVDIAVYGPGWSGALPAGVHCGEYIDNALLGAYYRGATRVLADHWGSMAGEGFIQNRIFDAVATGTRVISDPVDGIAERFLGAVQEYHTPDQLAHLCNSTSEADYPDINDMNKIAAHIHQHHSFTNRAQELISCVTQHRPAQEPDAGMVPALVRSRN